MPHVERDLGQFDELVDVVGLGLARLAAYPSIDRRRYANLTPCVEAGRLHA